MATLSKDLRRQLEKTVAEARKIAEDGAEQSLRRLAVELPRPHDALNKDETRLRVSLRAHARQLGDRLDQRPKHLIQAVAYEHWHRLLFARFLIENDLLLHPKHGVALSLEEVKEMALSENREWVEVAADYAQRMLLRRVFQPDDPALRVSLPPEKRQQLEAKLNSLPSEVFLADDSLGWVYQFWQKEAKEAVNKSEVRIGADELAPATQLFTEDYMVLSLLENTLGAWWTARYGNPKLPGYTWTYLRLNDNGTPAAGTFEEWPKSARELSVLDPCMGSGHFLTFALPLLVRMRIQEEGLSLKESIASVIRDNLFGLELDARCAQIAAFNLALTSWRLAGEHFPLPEMNLACSGLGINASEADWLTLAGEDVRAREEMRRLYSLFKDAPTLGSLIDPLRLQATILSTGAERVLPLLEEALKKEQTNDESRELVIAAQGVLAAFRILARNFTLVVTNVPYLGRRKQDKLLADYCEEFHGDAKADLSTCFIDRCLRFTSRGGSIGTVTPQNWLFLKTYKAFRERLLKTTNWNLVAKLGPNAFQDMNWWAATTALIGITNISAPEDNSFVGLDTSAVKDQVEKANLLASQPISLCPQRLQLLNPDARILLGEFSSLPLLSTFADFGKGSTTGDSPHYLRYFWELPSLPKIAVPWLDSPTPGDLWSGRSSILTNGLQDRSLLSEKGCFIRGQSVWNRRGVAVNKSNKLEPLISLGEVFDDNLGVLVPKNATNLATLFAFIDSPEYARNVRIVDQKVGVTAATLVKVPFDEAHWEGVSAVKYPDGLPKPFSRDPTQWLFDGRPEDSDHPLQTAVARLIGYRWPRQTGSSFLECPQLEPDGLESCADRDGIVCLAPLAGDDSAADRLRDLLRAAYGEKYNLAQLLSGKKSATLDEWLRDEFFEEHCRLFQLCPFVWHVWDGRKDGFHALVNYHKLAGPNGEARQTLEKLIYTSMGNWISRQRQDVANGTEGADGRLAAAEHLQSELRKILNGECPYDIFVRWKPLKEQSIGWTPDLNDGIRLNIRPWITAAKLYRSVKPGILRVTPKIKYGNDRGKEPTRDSNDFPWFNESPERNNDFHFTLEDKRKARGLA